MAISTTTLIKALDSIIADAQPSALPIPPPLILAGGFRRKGLSAREIAKEIIARQVEAGAPVGALPSGSENISEKMELIRIEVLLRNLLENMRITVVIPAGTPVASAGTAAGAPVVTNGATTSIAVGTGIIQ